MQRVTDRPTDRPTSRPADRARGAVARRAGARLPLVVVAGGLASLLFSANLASPLYVYSQRFGFSSAVLALIFAVYALVLIPSLLAFGQVSDRFGRRRVIAAGLGVGIAGLALFTVAGGVGRLFAARGVQGLSVGMISGAATAALVEFEPRNDQRRAALLATLANTGGSAAGPLVAGVLAQWAPAPTALPFAVGIALCVVVMASLVRVPEPIEPGSGRWRPQLPRVPREIRADFLRVGLTAATVWSVAGLFLSVVPSYVRVLDASGNLALVGATTSVMLAASCAAQVAVRRGAPPVAAQAGGLGPLALGPAGIAVFGTVTGAASLALAGWHLRRGARDHRPEERP